MKIMKIKNKYINWKSGFINYGFIEINWSIYDWALPIEIQFESYLFYLRILCISIILPKVFNKNSF